MEQAEDLSNTFNRVLAADLELMDRLAEGSDGQGSGNRHTVDLSNLRGGRRGAATSQAGYLADMAKADVLDAMGETEKAFSFVDRHL